LPYGQEITKTRYTIISDNHFIGGQSTQPVTIQPSDGNTWDERIQDVILERNWYTGASSACCLPMLIITARNVTVRNELIDMTGGTYHYGISISGAGSQSLASDRVWIYNNSMFSNDSNDFSAAVRVQSGTTNTTVRNNLAYSPNVSGLFIEGTATLVSNNTTTTNTNAYFTTVPPTTPAGFKPTCTGTTYPCGQGAAVPVWADFAGVTRPATPDIGAYQH
jgi:hypothetical protein